MNTMEYPGQSEERSVAYSQDVYDMPLLSATLFPEEPPPRESANRTAHMAPRRHAHWLFSSEQMPPNIENLRKEFSLAILIYAPGASQVARRSG